MTFRNANACLQSALDGQKQQMTSNSCFSQPFRFALSIEVRHTEIRGILQRKSILGSPLRPVFEMSRTLLLAKTFPRRTSFFPCVCFSAGPRRAYTRKTAEEEPHFRTSQSRQRHRSREAHKDHYKVLGVSSTATVQDIKMAFRRLARKYHPDVNKDFGADEMFKTICIAYKVLSDKTSRNALDVFLRHQTQAARKKTYKDRQAGYSRERSKPYNFQWRRGSYKRTIDYDDIWDSSLGDNGFMQNEGNEWSSVFGRNTAGKFCKDSDNSETWNKNRGFAWAEGWEKSIIESLVIFCLVAFIWHCFGAQLALTYFVFFMPHNKQNTAWYKIASVIAWLIGGKRGLALQYGIALTGCIYGKTYDNALAFVLMAIWMAGYLTQVIHLPRGAILLFAYLCSGFT